MGGILGLPQMIEIDPTEICNLRCRMCHVSYMPAEKRPLFDISLLPQLSSLRGCFVSVASGFEPMLYPDFDRLMLGLTALDMRLQIITNGTLCDRKNIDILRSSNMYVINFSFDGIRKETYEHIRRQANFEQTVERILATKEAFRGTDTFFLVNSTTMRSNLEEAIETIDYWDASGFDLVRFLPMVVRYPDPGLITESLFPIRQRAKQVFDEAASHVIHERKRTAILLPFLYASSVRTEHPDRFDGLYVTSAHPQTKKVLSLREMFQLGRHPLMHEYDCRAAFNTATILASGDVQLCYKYTVGSLRRQTFEEIWFGEAADRVRQKIIGSTEDCAACDCYRFGIAFSRLSADRRETYFAQELLPYLDSIDWETGRIQRSVAAKPPRLVGSEAEYNIVAYDGRYIAVPLAAGAFEVDKVDLNAIPGVFIEESYSRAIARVRAAASRH